MASQAPAANNVESPASSDGEDAAGAQVNSSDQWVTRCICINNSQVEGFMIECERCQVWQHGDCVRVDKGKVPDEYFCELCRPELHDARGLWTGGGARNQQAGKTAVSRSNSSKKKKTKSRKQSSQGGTAAGATAGNAVGEGSSDNAMIDVRGTSSQPDPSPPGAVAPDATSNGPDEEQKNLSREERKIVKIMQTIQMMEDRDKKRRRSGGTSATPDQQGSSNKGQSADEQTSKRRKSRPTSATKPAAGFDVPMLTIGGYDVEQLKTSPALLRNLFPVSPMYLGSKVFLLQQVTLMENSSNGLVSIPGTPIIHHKDRPLHTTLTRSASDEKRRFLKDERSTCRSPSPASRPGPSNQSANSSPFSSQPLSPAAAIGSGSPANAPNTRSSAAAVELPTRENMPAEQITDGLSSVEAPVQASADSSNAKPVLSSIPRLSTIPKVSLNPARSSDSGNAIASVAVVSKAAVFNPVPIPPVAVTGAVTPLSSLSELMQSYMNAPPTEFNPPGPLELTRFRMVNPGGVLPPLSVPIASPRWGTDPNNAAPPVPLPPSRFLPATPYRRVVPPPPSSLQTNNQQQSHPS